MTRTLVLTGIVALALAIARDARAEPQGHVAWRPAVCGVGRNDAVWEKTRFCNGLIGDLLFFRQKNRDWGFGPYVEVTTAGFWDVRWGGGGTLLVPLSENFPLTFSLGISEHALRTPALSASTFFGARSYDFDGSYNWALGVFASAARDLGDEHETLVSAGFEIDGFFVIAPFLLGISALR